MSAPAHAPPTSAHKLLGLIQAHGVAATSFQCLGPGLCTWTRDDGRGAVCYVATGRSWVVAGEPICPAHLLSDTVDSFVAAARAQRRRVVFFAAEAHLISCLRDSAPGAFTWVKIGEQPVFDPRGWSLAGRHRRNVRAQVLRAGNHGVAVRQALPEEVAEGGVLRRACERLMDAWKDSRHMSMMGFLVDLNPFDHLQERRYFVALRQGELIGLLAAAPVYGKRGWFIEDLIRHPDAPNGTAEALVDHALCTFGAEGAPFATLGLAPLSGGASPEAERAPSGVLPWLPLIFDLSFEHANFLYSFKGLRAFKEKFKPGSWAPVYMAVSPGRVRPAVVWDMLSAFVPVSRLQFALDTSVRVVRALSKGVPDRVWQATAWLFSLALVPWIFLLLSVDPERRFGAAWLPWAWVSFDAVMALLFSLLATALSKWPRFAWSLSRVMLGGVLADLWLTSAQIFLFNLPQATHWYDVAVGLIAVTAPAAASLFLALLVVRLKPGG